MTPRPGRRLMITAFGWNDSGGGTTVPRLAAKELARRGWEVTVFHAAVARTPSGRPYELREWVEDGVSLVGVHNRPSTLFDRSAPEREIDDPAISMAFSALLDRVRPDVVHFHNLHNLGASLFDHAAARGLPAYFSTHNYWLVCPRVYLLTGQGSICAGPGDRGGDCAACVGSHDTEAYRRRLGEIRARATRSLTACLAVSDAMRQTLIAEGYPADLVDVVRQAMPMEQEIWEGVGRDRAPGRAGDELTIGFLGSAYPHKGPQLLVEAAQRTRARVRVQIHGEVPDAFAAQLRALDRRGVVQLSGAFSPEEISERLRGVDVAALPSLWWDCAPLAAAECRAARVPLVVPRLGGLPEVVQDETDGLVFNGLDAEDLTRQLDRLADEAGLLERLQRGIAPPRSFSSYIDELEAYYAGERPSRASSGEPAAPAVRWVGEHGRAVSLSIINGQVTSRLPGRVQRVARDGSTAAGDAPLPHVADVEVRHQWPPDLGPAPGGRLAVIQPWEFGAIPADWVAPLRENVDELWVPSEYVRRMYLAAGVDERRVVTIPNGVDLERFAPEGPRMELDGAPGIRFLFVGGVIWRKGQDVLLEGWRAAFAGRDDVTLVVKDVGAADVYRNANREEMRAHARSGELPRVCLIEEELGDDELAALYRACDVLVHPYRGEGFAMPVLEAMACGLPVIATAGGPTDEFCPPAAGWRIRSSPAQFPSDRVDTLETVGRPWVLEPDVASLAGLLREAAADPQERRRRGAAGRQAAQALGWDAVAARYAARVQALAGRPPLLAGAQPPEPFPLHGEYALRVLATPAWRTEDRLGGTARAVDRGDVARAERLPVPARRPGGRWRARRARVPGAGGRRGCRGRTRRGRGHRCADGAAARRPRRAPARGRGRVCPAARSVHRARAPGGRRAQRGVVAGRRLAGAGAERRRGRARPGRVGAARGAGRAGLRAGSPRGRGGAARLRGGPPGCVARGRRPAAGLRAMPRAGVCSLDRHSGGQVNKPPGSRRCRQRDNVSGELRRGRGTGGIDRSGALQLRPAHGNHRAGNQQERRPRCGRGHPHGRVDQGLRGHRLRGRRRVEPRGAGGRDLRPARTQRGRQDDDGRHADHAGDPHLGAGVRRSG